MLADGCLFDGRQSLPEHSTIGRCHLDVLEPKRRPECLQTDTASGMTVVEDVENTGFRGVVTVVDRAHQMVTADMYTSGVPCAVSKTEVVALEGARQRPLTGLQRAGFVAVPGDRIVEIIAWLRTAEEQRERVSAGDSHGVDRKIVVSPLLVAK